MFKTTYAFGDHGKIFEVPCNVIMSQKSLIVFKNRFKRPKCNRGYSRPSICLTRIQSSSYNPVEGGRIRDLQKSSFYS